MSESGVHCLVLNVVTFCRKFSTHVTVGFCLYNQVNFKFLCSFLIFLSHPVMHAKYIYSLPGKVYNNINTKKNDFVFLISLS